MMVETYIQFNRKFAQFIFAYHQGATTEHYCSVDIPLFVSDIAPRLKRCTIFHIGDNIVKDMLLSTKNPPQDMELHLPFPDIFVDVSFTKEELARHGFKVDVQRVTGLLIRKGKVYPKSYPGVVESDGVFDPQIMVKDADEIIKEHHLDEDVSVGSSLRISVMVEDDNLIRFDTYNGVVHIDNPHLKSAKLQHKSFDKKTCKAVTTFALNFLNYVNMPEIKLIHHPVSEKNRQRRKREGKMELPSQTIIKLTGEIKRYIDMLKQDQAPTSHYGYRFDVKGHFRHFTSDYYKEAKGKVRWIPPYIKGQHGIYVKKMYEVGE